MAKTRRRKKPEAVAVAVAAKPATTLLEFTEHGLDALRARRPPRPGSDGSKLANHKRRAFEEAIERLRADYANVLKRRD